MAKVEVSSWTMRQMLQHSIQSSEEPELRIYVKAVDGKEHTLFGPFTVAEDHISYKTGSTGDHKVALMPYSSIVQIVV